MDAASMLRDIVAGGMAGSMGMALGVPLDTIKVRMQSMPEKYKSPLQTFTSTMRSEGFLGFFRGSLSPLSAQIVINALCFSSESFAMRILQPGLGPHESGTTLNVCLAGSFGGFVQCFALVPTDLIKCKLQVDNKSTGKKRKPQYKGIMDCVKQTVRKEGFMGLYRGFGVTVLREVPSYAVYFSTYRYVKRITTPEDSDPTTWGMLLAGGLAGCATWASVYPVDVVKSVVQTQPLGTDASLMAVTRKILAERGPLFFYRGLSVTMLRSFPVNAATFFLYEQFQEYFRETLDSDI